MASQRIMDFLARCQAQKIKRVDLGGVVLKVSDVSDLVKELDVAHRALQPFAVACEGAYASEPKRFYPDTAPVAVELGPCREAHRILREARTA